MHGRARPIGITVSAAILMLTACHSGGSNPKPVATSGPGSGFVVVHGIVTNHGKPLSGAKVWLALWPEDDDTKEGETVDVRNIAPATTGSDGKYALRIDPEKLSSKYFNGDFLNFEIDVFHRGAEGIWNSTVSLIDKRVWRSDEQARIADPVLAMNFDLGKSTIATTDSLGERESSELPVSQLPDGVAPWK